MPIVDLTPKARPRVRNRVLGALGALLVAAAAPACSDSGMDVGGTRDGGTSRIDGGRADGVGAVDGQAFDRVVPTLDARTIEPDGTGCRFVDVLFVIDNSSSMGEYQARLAQAFPGFVDAMFERLPRGTNLHVAVTTTDFYAGSTSEATTNCRSAATPEYIRSRYVTPVESTTTENGAQGRLFQHQGRGYFEADTSGDRAGLRAWFTSAATAAGENGSSIECASAGAGYAVHAANARANGGFLRDRGAVLLVIVLSDEPDKSPEPVATYHNMLTAAKAGCGGDSCILTAGILDPCTSGTNDTVVQFLNSFGRTTRLTSIDGTAAQYSAFVGDALAQIVAERCSAIAPP